jgi:hypothetical protein
MTPIHSARARGGIAAALLVLTGACMEPKHVASPASTLSDRDTGVMLVVSDSAPPAGSIVSVTVQLTSGTTIPRIASYTARVSYDTVSLQLTGESALDAVATRVMNPLGQTVRVAGFAVDGIPDARLFAFTFQTRNGRGGEALRAIDVVFTELHTIAHEDLRARVRPLGVVREARK